MRKVLYTGRLSPEMTLIVNLSNILAWVTGSARDTAAMKLRVRRGYEGACSNHVTQYDDLALAHFSRIAGALLESVDLDGREVLDVGCGTGILSLRALQGGAAKAVCGDTSEYMLSQCEKKLAKLGFEAGRFETRRLDAGSLPYSDGSFDAVISSMVLHIVPDQEKVVDEMARVLRKGGTFAIATAGPDCWWEAADAVARSTPKRYMLGYRIEYWPRRESEIQAMLDRAGLADIRTRRLLWQDSFATGADAYDFFGAASALWWLSKFPPNAAAEVSRGTREYCDRAKRDRITQDIILAYGRKP